MPDTSTNTYFDTTLACPVTSCKIMAGTNCDEAEDTGAFRLKQVPESGSTPSGFEVEWTPKSMGLDNNICLVCSNAQGTKLT